MNPAKFPEELTEPNERHVSDIAPGETAYTRFTALRVDENGDCFLALTGQLGPADNLGSMEVRRDSDGH